ncbi:MAG: Rrf2 family transcriptional regulator [Candidatus Margulisiibacteriota bacterium]|jgi:Rrf2 family protein
MQITYKCDYALKVLLELALNKNNGVISVFDLAQKLDIPIKFLEQIAAELKRAKLITSKRGSQGGYFLAITPEQIIIGQIVRLIDGSIGPISCINKDYQGCSFTDNCVYKNLWQKVYQATSDIIDKTTLADLVKETKEQSNALFYSI